VRLEERFTYDRLNRLVRGELRGINGNLRAASETISLAYDKLGNICWQASLARHRVETIAIL
jgi:hypothetical protein